MSFSKKRTRANGSASRALTGASPLLLAAVAALTAGCESNPYPELKNGISATRPDVSKPFPDMTLDFPSVMDFREGEEAGYEIRFSARDGGGRLEVTGLPPGARFDPQDRFVRWRPDYDAGTDPKDPQSQSRSYPINVYLIGKDGRSTLKRPATLLVRNVRRPMLIYANAVSVLRQLDAFEQQVVVASQEGGDVGAISLHSGDLPVGAKIDRDPANPARRLIRFTPPVGFVRPGDPTDAQGRYRKLAIRLDAISPSGEIASKPIEWTVRDNRLAFSMTGPGSAKGYPSVAFSIAASNPNLDSAPTVRLVQRPTFGSLALNTSSSSGLTIVALEWTDIPRDQIGATHELRFETCDGVAPGGPACTSKTVQVTFERESRPAPLIDRAKWLFGELKTVPVEQEQSFDLPAKDAETLAPLTAVAIEKSSGDFEAAWQNGVLRIRAHATGPRQFNVVATSPLGAVLRESFFFMAEPAAPAAGEFR